MVVEIKSVKIQKSKLPFCHWNWLQHFI